MQIVVEREFGVFKTEHRIQTLYYCSIIGFLLLFVYSLLYFILDNPFMGWFNLISAGAILVNGLILIYLKNSMLASHVAMSVLYLVCLELLFNGGLGDTGIYWLFLYPILGFLTLSLRGAFLWISALYSSVLFIMIFQFSYGAVITPFSNVELSQSFVSLIFAALLIYFYRNITVQNSQQLGELTMDLRRVNLRLSQQKDELKEYSSKLQDTVGQLRDTKIAMLNILEDIDEERQKTQKHADELLKFQQAVEYSTDHIVITDPDGIILYANRSVNTITGFTQKELIGTKAGSKANWGGLMPRSFYTHMWKELKRKKKPFEGKVNNRRKNGEYYVARATISPVFDGNGDIKFFIGIERDVTKEDQIDKMKTEFISLASHQLRTPLSAMKWFLEMLLDGDAGDLKKEQKEFVMKVNDSNERMIELVNSLLNVSRIETGRLLIEPMEIDLKHLVMDCVEYMKIKADAKQQVLKFHCEKSIKPIVLDPKLLRQVLLNLLSNAIKYTPEKGSILVTLTNRSRSIIISVKDTGYGIPKKEQEKIFSKFFRANNIVHVETDGNGLGLYLAKAVVDAFKGQLWFESEENRGTTFYISIPQKGVIAKKGEISLLEAK